MLMATPGARCTPCSGENEPSSTSYPSEERERRARAIARLETSQAITGILTEAAALQAFSVVVDDIDADPWLFNCANGTLDLRTMELREHNPDDRITKIARAAYTPNAGGADVDSVPCAGAAGPGRV